MEQDTKEEVSEKPKSTPTAEKYGWIKKSSGGLLGLWKDRYIQLRKTQLMVFEDEDEQKCIETVELESYDKCQELRALLKKKNRFILIRSPGKKVHDIKFQAPTLEEKESWIKALNEGINRGKNKIFDEVKVDSLSLDHVTRDRVKVSHGRRPPTRSHLKEAAKSTSDGILRLDLDIVDHGPLNLDSTVSESNNVPPPKETPKPPMPPTKPSGAKENHDAENSVPDLDHKQPLSPPLPPDKKLKEGLASKDSVDTKEEDSVNTEENVEGSQASDEENRENLTEVSTRSIAKAPIPAPRSVPDKLKVAWDQPVPEPKHTEDSIPSEDSSKDDNLADVAAADATKPPVPPKVLSENLLAMMNSSDGALADDSCEDQESDSPKPPVNGIAVSEAAEFTSPAAESEEGNGTTSAQKEEQTSVEEIETSLATEPGNESIKAAVEKRVSAESTSSLKLRSSSLGDLLSNSNTRQRALPGQGFLQDQCLAKMEEKVVNEREKAEKLLQKVLREGLEQAQDGNGPPVMAETLLNEAVEQLRQATQVLQEIKGLGELKKEATQKQKEKQKDLVTLYRRSAP